jgi:hypothetical protein
MSNIYKKLEITAANQDFFTDLTEQDAEAINGGYETFTIENDVSNYKMSYTVDGTSATLDPGYYTNWTAYSGGLVEFDADGRSGYQPSRKYNLGSGRTYSFQPNTSTSNPYDFDLYDIT